MEKLKGYYLGTVIDEKWWKKYFKYTLISRVQGSTGKQMKEYTIAPHTLSKSKCH